MKKRNPFNWLRWIARIAGTLMVLFTLLWMAGEIIEGWGRPHTSVSFQMWAFFGAWGIATAGLILALWKEGLGGIISLVSYFLVFYLSNGGFVSSTNTTSGIAIIGFLIFLAGLILFLWNEYLGTILLLTGYILVFIPDLIIHMDTGAKRNLHILLFILSFPSALYLVYWKLNRDELRKEDVAKSEESTSFFTS